MRKTLYTCDRCGDDAEKEVELLGVKGLFGRHCASDKVDLCNKCFDLLIDFHKRFIKHQAISIAGECSP